MRVKVPRLVIAGLAGDSGKTLVSLGLARALADRGLKVRPFKKGPDYIDAAWLGLAARHTCRNLDTFMMSDEAMAGALATAASDADIILVEGNRGLFDGVDVEGSHSTAILARRPAAAVPFPEPDARRQLGSPSGSIASHRQRPVYPKPNRYPPAPSPSTGFCLNAPP